MNRNSAHRADPRAMKPSVPAPQREVANASQPHGSDASQGDRLDALCFAGWRLWERFDRDVRDREFHPFVAADYAVVRIALHACYAPGLRFLEWGSATGVITVMADLLGYEACGIELDARLVETARTLATQFHSTAHFVAGSFVPTGYRGPPGRLVAESDTIGEGLSGYLQLGRALDEFDVVFGYPWHGDAPLMLDLMHHYGRPNAVLLLNDTTEGVRAYRGGREIGRYL